MADTDLDALERRIWNAYQDQGHIDHNGWTYRQGVATCTCGALIDLSSRPDAKRRET